MQCSQNFLLMIKGLELQLRTLMVEIILRLGKCLQRRFDGKIEKHFEEGIDEEEIKTSLCFLLLDLCLYLCTWGNVSEIPSLRICTKSIEKITDTNHAWSWRSEELETEARFITNPIHINKDTKNVGIVLSLSAKIPSERFAKLVSDNYCIYEITIENPSMYFLKCPKQIEEFSRKYRELLNDIQTTHGDTCNIFYHSSSFQPQSQLNVVELFCQNQIR